MGYFHKIRQSKDFARQKKEEEKAKSMEPEPPKERYVHRPRHARADAINSTPLHYSTADRQQISENSRRRSQMLFSSRNNSGYSTPTTLTRPGSYSEGLAWADRGDINARPVGLRRSHSGFTHSGPSRQSSRMYISKEPMPPPPTSPIETPELSTGATSTNPSPNDSNSPSLKSNASSSYDYLEMGRPKRPSASRHSSFAGKRLEGDPPKNQEQVHWAEIPEITVIEPLDISSGSNFRPESPVVIPVEPPVAVEEPAVKAKRSFLPWKKSKAVKA